MSNDGHVLRAYVFMPDGYTPLLMMTFEVVDQNDAVSACYAYHNHHPSTPRAMTDDSGAVVWRASLAPFGQRIGACDTDQDGADDDACPVEQPLRFPGQWDDAGTGLYYNWHRYYVPGLGVYTRLDPLSVGSLLDGLPGRTGGRSGYSYGRGSPGLLGDPAGLWEMPSAESPFPSDPYEELFGPLGTEQDYLEYWEDEVRSAHPDWELMPSAPNASPFYNFEHKTMVLDGLKPTAYKGPGSRFATDLCRQKTEECEVECVKVFDCGAQQPGSEHECMRHCVPEECGY
jgi:RHS repeat-associated protein